MSIIKNMDKLSNVLTPDKVVELEYGANLHLRYSNIAFKIISYEQEALTVRVEQSKPAAENTATGEELRLLSKELFSRYITNEIHVHAVPYIPSPVEVVDPKWITGKMLAKGVRIKDIQTDTGIDKTNLSAWVNGIRPMSQPVKAMFYYYFEWYIISDKLTKNAS